MTDKIDKFDGQQPFQHSVDPSADWLENYLKNDISGKQAPQVQEDPWHPIKESGERKFYLTNRECERYASLNVIRTPVKFERIAENRIRIETEHRITAINISKSDFQTNRLLNLSRMTIGDHTYVIADFSELSSYQKDEDKYAQQYIFENKELAEKFIADIQEHLLGVKPAEPEKVLIEVPKKCWIPKCLHSVHLPVYIALACIALISILGACKS